MLEKVATYTPRLGTLLLLLLLPALLLIHFFPCLSFLFGRPRN
ncbi:unnamed protein product [Amoebophrya sp. A25]|nr:unnamed protein product [Amoebophrya sp. A25]|eukprot:GSA25T00020341001.1